MCDSAVPCRRTFTWTLLIAVVVGCAAFGADVRGADAQPGLEGQSRWAWRDVISEKLQQQAVTVELKPPAPRDPDLSPLLLRAGHDPDVLTLAPIYVNGARMESQLRRNFAKADKEAREEAVMRRAGIGFYGKKFGGATVGVATVFFIPVQATISWDW